MSADTKYGSARACADRSDNRRIASSAFLLPLSGSFIPLAIIRMRKPFLVFLIDDDPEDQCFFFMAVERMENPVQCVFANNGLQAINKLTSEPGFAPDFIFIDINMPLMNGIECLTELRKIERLGHIPVYMYSTSNDQRMVDQCLSTGAIGVIQKVPSIISLKEILCQVFAGQKVSVF